VEHRTFFNSIAPLWDEMSHHDGASLRRILDHMELYPACTVLDAGCGTGAFSELMVNECAYPLGIVCLDISEDMLRGAKRRLQKVKNITYVQGDLSMPCFAGRIFDRIICFSCFPHIKGKSSALANLEHALKDEGMLVIAHADNYQKINEFHARCSEPIRNDYLPCPEEMRMLLENACLGSISIIDEPHLFIVTARPERRAYPGPSGS